jgi:hypothetical protein
VAGGVSWHQVLAVILAGIFQSIFHPKGFATSVDNRFFIARPRRFRPLVLLPLSLSLLALADGPLHPPAHAQEAAATSPRAALVTGVRGTDVTLDIGQEQGAVRGAVYTLSRGGREVARVQIVTVRGGESSARVLDAGPDLALAVGDTLAFQSVQPVAEPEPPAPVEDPAPVVDPPVVTPPVVEPPVVEPPVVEPPVATPTTPTLPTVPATPGTTANLPTTGATVLANVIAVEGNTVTFDAGLDQGVRSGSKVAIARNGDVVAIARITIVEATRSQGNVIFADSVAGGPQPGDSAPLLNAPLIPVPATSDVPDVVVSPTPAPAPVAPTDNGLGARIRFETGASNEVVPRADESYDYLAALAAAKLLPRQYSAHLFHDDGARSHRTEEDLTLSRAQIAQLTLGALRASVAREEGPSAKEEAALRALAREFRRELQVLGATPIELQVLGGLPVENPTPNDPQIVVVDPETGATIPSDSTTASAATGGERSGRRGFFFGVSGQQRASIVGGSARNGGNEPFSERQGTRRTRSGFDTRTNIFGQAGDNLRFFVQAHGGSDPRRGATGNDGGGFQLREAYIDYNANKLLRGLNVKLGRDEIWWGPGHFGTLLLSDTPGPLNLLQTSFKRGSYELQGLYAPLDRGPGGGRRSLYGHNLSVRVGSQTRIGIAETLLLPRDRVDPIAFVGAYSPIPLFTLERLRKRNTSAENGNILVEAYLETSLARGVRAWGEFLLDDIGSNSNNLTRNRLGALLGAHLFNPRDPGKLGVFAEYATLSGRTYLALRSPSDSDYFYRGDPLGYPVAPVPGAGAGVANGGAESLRLEAYWRPTDRLRLGGGVEFADLNGEDAFRSRQQVLRLRASYDIGRSFTIVGRLQRVSTDNFGFAPGTRKQNLVQLEIVRSY